MAQLLGSEESDLEQDVVVAATFKVLVLGNSNVGKSSLIKRYSAAEKPESMMPTIGQYKLMQDVSNYCFCLGHSEHCITSVFCERYSVVPF